MIVAGFCFRYEPDWLIDQLLENVAWMDGHVSVDTRNDPRPWIPKAERIAAILDKARDADWLFEIDPDERLEPDAEPVLRGAAEEGPDWLRVRLREMWTPTAYRVDRRWGKKTRGRFRHLSVTRRPRNARLLDVNLYHLKMIEPENRAERRRVHSTWNRWDNGGRFAYLTNEQGLKLEEIPEGRGYVPAYRRWEFKVDA